MVSIYRLLFLAFVVVGCSSNPVEEKIEKIESPLSEDLTSIQYYPGDWEMDKCLKGGKQAERVQIEMRGDKLVLQRWQRKVDKQPLFTAVIQPNHQTEISYKSKDLINENPIINKTQWSWMNHRIVGNMLWRPGLGDQRGNWLAVASGQFYIRKGEPHQMRWVRWGSSHSERHGQQTWQSECIYRRMSKLPTSVVRGASAGAKATAVHPY